MKNLFDGAGQIITVNLNALKSNYLYLQSLSPCSECAVVVKANAYGLGYSKISTALYDCGARSYFVAHVSEAVALRTILPKIKIYVLNGFDAQYYDLYKSNNIIAILGSENNLYDFFCLAKNDSSPPSYALHFDTGMHRLGLSLEFAAKISSQLSIQPVLLISHYACADELGSPMNSLQFTKFEILKQYFPNVEMSLSNSHGILSPRQQFSLMRAGIALYGGVDNFQYKVLPVVKYHARILQIQTVKKGETIGYGAGFTATYDMKIATISIGYADGIPRFISTEPFAHHPVYFLFGINKARIIGKISMDLTTVDVTHIDDGILQKMDYVEIFGENQSITEFANSIHTIEYEVLTSLSKRATRVYV